MMRRTVQLTGSLTPNFGQDCIMRANPAEARAPLEFLDHVLPAVPSLQNLVPAKAGLGVDGLALGDKRVLSRVRGALNHNRKENGNCHSSLVVPRGRIGLRQLQLVGVLVSPVVVKPLRDVDLSRLLHLTKAAKFCLHGIVTPLLQDRLVFDLLLL